MLKFYINFIILLNFKIINLNQNNNEIKHSSIFKGIYKISSLFNNLNFLYIKNKIILSEKQSPFLIIKVSSNSYYIVTRKSHQLLGIDKHDNIISYKKNENNKRIYWNIINISSNQYLIQNKYNQKYMKVNNIDIHCSNLTYIKSLIKIDNKFIFSFLKLFEEAYFIKDYNKIIDKEPIDIVIKYIDLTDKNLKRIGIKQIYKDKDNEELKYSIRSILENIPWIRKIFIVMPNDKVRFLKSTDEIKEKIIYIKDSDILGFDSANIFAFTFNFYNLEKFGVSKNFIYIEDDFFFGRPLKKKDFFYYDNEIKKVIPYLLTSHFHEINRTNILNEYNNMFKIKDFIHPHSGEGWSLSIICTEKYFIERFNFPLISTQYTHNAMGENIDDLKEIYKEIKNYEFFNETIFSKERFILTLNQPHFFNLYQLNINHKRVHSIPYKYIAMEYLNKMNINIQLFVINTGGNHEPLNRQFKIQKKIMAKYFYSPNKYEIKEKKKENRNYLYFYIFTIFYFIKLFLILSYLFKKLNIYL